MISTGTGGGASVSGNFLFKRTSNYLFTFSVFIQTQSFFFSCIFACCENGSTKGSWRKKSCYDSDSFLSYCSGNYWTWGITCYQVANSLQHDEDGYFVADYYQGLKQSVFFLSSQGIQKAKRGMSFSQSIPPLTKIPSWKLCCFVFHV